MADFVVAVGIEGAVARDVGREASVRVVHVDPEGLGEVGASVAPVAFLVGDAADPVHLAQVAHHARRDASVLLVSPSAEEAEAVARTLSITPGISRHTYCFSLDRPDLAASLAEEVEWAVKRLGSRHVLDRLRDSRVETPGGEETGSALRYLDRLFDHAPVGIVLVDPSGTIRAVNPAGAAIIGGRVDSTVGSPFASLFSPDHAVRAQRVLEEATGRDEPQVDLLTRPGPDGRDQHLEVTATAVDPDLRQLGLMVLIRDESDRLRAAEAAERARAEAVGAAEGFEHLARTLQSSLLPPELPSLHGVELAARYHSAGSRTEVGGDFYDVFRLADGRWCVVLGDVSGKGVEAASMTALVRYSLCTVGLLTGDVPELLRTVNRAVARYGSGERFSTLAIVALAEDRSGVEVAIAGHPRPTLLRRDGSLQALGEPALPLGLFESVEVEVASASLQAGDAVVITSDGVTEARLESGELAPDVLERVLPAVAGEDAQEIAGAIDRAVLRVERRQRRDDLAIVVIRRR